MKTHIRPERESVAAAISSVKSLVLVGENLQQISHIQTLMAAAEAWLESQEANNDERWLLLGQEDIICDGDEYSHGDGRWVSAGAFLGRKVLEYALIFRRPKRQIIKAAKMTTDEITLMDRLVSDRIVSGYDAAKCEILKRRAAINS